MPFLKVVNDTAVAVNQGGKRKGAVCTYLETLAPRHRGVPRAAQEHRRRPPPHARHEHGELDSRPVHEARDGRRRLDAVLAVRRARPARQVGQGVRGGLHALRGQGGARRAEALQEDPGRCSSGARCCRCCSRPGIRGSRSRTPATCARRSSTSASCTAPTCAPRSRSTPATTEIAVCNLGSVNLLAHMKQTATAAGSSTTTKLQTHDPHRDADARQRDRHQLLRGGEGAQLQPQAPPGGPRHHGLPGLPAPAAHALRVGRRGGVRRPLDGSGLLLRLLGVDRARRGARPLLVVQGQPVGPRHPAAGHAEAPARGARRLRRDRRVVDDGLGRAARAHHAARHAQLQLRGDRADGDDLQHHRRRRVDRARVPEHLRQVEPVGRVHRRQRAPGRRPEEARTCGTR